MRFPVALILVALCGFIALSYEILWVRVYSFLSAGAAYSFGFLLGSYLLGIAFGSLFSQFYCKDKEETQPLHMKALAFFVFFANVTGFFLIPIVGWLVRYISYGWTYPLVVLAAALLGATFPLISHFGIKPDDAVGKNLSYLYLANIIGSATGSLLTGFVLMDYWSTQNIAVFLALLGLAFFVVLLFPAKIRGKNFNISLVLVLIMSIFILSSQDFLFDRIYEKLFQKQNYNPQEPYFAHTIENRSGVITVSKDGAVYGGGVYDGYVNVNLKPGEWIVRAYILSAFHPAPEEVLMIGLSSGSWANIIAHNPNVKKLTIIEINPGYLELIPRYPEVASLLKNPKVEIIIDDGRRFLSKHPKLKYDAIIANTTFHWRAHATNLLSQEYFAKVKKHLKEGGLYFFNATGSWDVQKTAATSFSSALMILNCVMISDAPLVPNKERWRKTLAQYQIDGNKIFDLTTNEGKQNLEKILPLLDTLEKPPEDPSEPYVIESRESILSRTQKNIIITDDNMGTEWKNLWWNLDKWWKGKADSSH